MTYNLIIKTATDRPDYLIDLKTAMATRLSENKFNALKALNPALLGDYRFIAFKDTDFSWWGKVTRYLTANRIYNNCVFEIDFKGNITKW